MADPGQHRIHTTPRPDGCDVHLDGFVHQGLVDLIGLLRDNGVLWDDLVALIDNPPAPPDSFQPERDLPTEDLANRLAEHLPTAIRLHREATTTLGTTLTSIAQQQARTTTATPATGQVAA